MTKELDSDFIEALLDSFEDKRVIEKIKGIAAPDLVSKMKDPQELLQGKENEIARLQEEIKSKKEEIKAYRIQVRELNELMDAQGKELQKRRADCWEAEEQYEAFQQLSDITRNSLKGIFKGKTVQEFLVCGVQYENISSLWDFIKNEIMEGREEEREALLALFQFFFQEYSKTYDTPLYKPQEVKINEVFREDQYIRTLNSRISGNVTEILLPGYISINGKIIKKSIVRI